METPTIKRIKPLDVSRSNGFSFDKWFSLLNLFCVQKYGISIHDLGDFPSRDQWSDDASIVEGLDVAMEWNDYPFEEA